MANFFSREARFMLIWLIVIPAIVFVVAIIAVFLWRHA